MSCKGLKRIFEGHDTPVLDAAYILTSAGDNITT